LEFADADGCAGVKIGVIIVDVNVDVGAVVIFEEV
jgi:hypothetical protein